MIGLSASLKDDVLARANAASTCPAKGWLTQARSPILRATFEGVKQGAMCQVVPREGNPVLAQVIGVDGREVILHPFGATEGLAARDTVERSDATLVLPLGQGLLGRIVDVFGAPIDGFGSVTGQLHPGAIKCSAPPAMSRPLIDSPLATGMRAIDGPLTLGRGQRVAVFGPPGTGKSSLLATIARHTSADVIVLGLVGERGREVREFSERDLPLQERGSVVMVVASSDAHPAERALCAQSATAVAEWFRDAGKSVLLLIDSITRTARALREIGLAAGEPPARQGYPASVYPALPALIERAGRTDKGDITALYTVLLEDDDHPDPIAEEVKSLTDGHFILSRKLAERGHFPAIDVLQSLSRTMDAVVSGPHKAAARDLRRLLAKHCDMELLLQVGEYQAGTDALADQAIAAKPRIDRMLQQGTAEVSSLEKTLQSLMKATQ